MSAERVQAVRCGFCPGAPAKVAAIARTPCPRCAAGVLAARPTCPSCGGLMLIDTEAESGDGQPCVVAFCCECEFCIEVQASPENACGRRRR